MVTVVIDASVAAQWYLNEAYSEQATSLLARPDLALIAPAIIAAEIANVAWKAHRRGAISEKNAVDLLDRFRESGVRFVPVEDVVEYALDLAIRHRHAVYDCLYLALALQEDCAFVTADREFYDLMSPGLPNNVLWVEDIPA